MSQRQAELAKLIVESIVFLSLVLTMAWIVISPTTTDEASKAALVIVGSAVGFLFGRHTT